MSAGTLNLVTGGAGFIGSHLVEALVRGGERVRVLDDLSSGKEENLEPVARKVELVRASIADPRACERAMAGVTTVYHLAACPSVVKSFDEPAFSHDVNATGTLNVVVAAGKAKVRRLVFAGSCAVYGNAGAGPAREEQLLDPQSPYAAQKLLGEHYCRQFGTALGLEAVLLRFFNVYGPRQDPGSPYSGVISIFCEKLLAGAAPLIHGDGLQTRDFVAVEDVVQALMKAATAELPFGTLLGNAGSGASTSACTFNVATGTSRTVLDLHRELAQLIGHAGEPRFGPARTGDVRISAADISRTRRALGYEPRIAFQEGLARTVSWYRSRRDR